MDHGHTDPGSARLGDWLELEGAAGYSSRRGQIVEILGRPGHVHFRVRWDEEHESIVYPAEHGAIVHHASRRGSDIARRPARDRRTAA
jgi:hypothetical protein